MPAKLVATVMAEGVSIDALTGRVTLFNALSHIYASQFPASLHRLIIATQYERDSEPDRFRERITLRSPGGGLLGESVTEQLLDSRSSDQPPGYWSFHALWRLRFDEPGDYTVDIWRQSGEEVEQWKAVTSCTLWVQLAAHPLAPVEEEIPKQEEPPIRRAE
jgi:hypothetical protein